MKNLGKKMGGYYPQLCMDYCNAILHCIVYHRRNPPRKCRVEIHSFVGHCYYNHVCKVDVGIRH